MSEFVDNIREITREDDYNMILKSSMGGYTKKSVLEYLASVREQQETLRNAYTAEISELKKEQERLRTEVSESRNKSEKIRSLEEERDRLLSENRTLKEECGALEKDMDEAVERIASDGAKIEKLEAELLEEQVLHDASENSSVTCRMMLEAAEEKAEKAFLSIREKEEEIASLEVENQYLKEHVAKEKISELNDRITQLLSETEQLQSELETRNKKLKNYETQVAELLTGLEKERAASEKVREELDSRREQCEWQENISADLSRRLLCQMEENLLLGKENSRLRAVETILRRKTENHE